MHRPSGTTRVRNVIASFSAASLVAAAVFLSAVAGAPPARAAGGCTAEFGVTDGDSGSPAYHFERCGVPDFDQIRSGLVNDGKMYCAPTAAVDWLHYLANRGASSVMPGPGLSDNYLQVQYDISLLAQLMSTNPADDGGTAGSNAVAGIRAYLDQSYNGHGGDYFAVQGMWGRVERVDGQRHVYRPTGGDLAAWAAGGALVMPDISWYKVVNLSLIHI